MTIKISKLVAKLEKKQIMRKKYHGRWQRCCLASFLDDFAYYGFFKNFEGVVSEMLKGETVQMGAKGQFRIK